MGVSRAGNKFDEICLLAIPKQIFLMSMHILKLSSGNKNMGMSRADNSVRI